MNKTHCRVTTMAVSLCPKLTKLPRSGDSPQNKSEDARFDSWVVATGLCACCFC